MNLIDLSLLFVYRKPDSIDCKMNQERFTDIYHHKKQDEYTNQQGKIKALHMDYDDIFFYIVW